MTRSQQRRVRDPFYTTKHSGSGLGLFISNHLIAEMGGRLDIDSGPGDGTKVIITLPQRLKR
jgi:signal transduction histidine kinase